MGSGQSTVAARTRNGGAKTNPIILSSPSKSPPARRQIHEKTAEKVRVDQNSGRVQKLSSAPKQAAAPTPAQLLIAAAATARQIVREPPKAVLANPPRYGLRSRARSPSPPRHTQDVPFALQMTLFATTQKLVEETLFYWTKEWVPEVLANKKWHQPEQTELNYWFRSFDEKRVLKNLVVHALAQSRSGLSYKDLRDLLQSLQHIRHAAVHRKQYNTPYIRELMADAIRITHCMDDPLRNKKIREMQKALIKDDLERLKSVIGMPIEDFEAPVASLSGPVGKQGADGKAGQDPASRKHADLHSKVEAVEQQSVSSEARKGSATNNLPADFGAICGKENRNEKAGPSRGMTMPRGLPSAERGFGTRRENMTLASSNNGGHTRSSAKNAATAEIIDLTEDGDDDLFEDAREQQPIIKKKEQEDTIQRPNKRAFHYVGRNLIDISDTDSGKESGEIDENPEPDDDDDDEDDDDTIHFSNAPRMHPYAQYKRPRLGKDF